MNPWSSNLWQQPQQPNWFPPNAHPHVYVPPPYARPTAYWEQQPWNHSPEITAPYYNGFRSSLYPHLHPILAADTTLLRYDVQKKPRSDIISSTYHATGQAPATAGPVTHMRLLSKAFPWSIDIIMTTPTITCEVVWDAIHAALQEPLADSEWGLVVANDETRKRVLKAAKRRTEGEKDKSLKRIDWLGERTMFKGLEKDDEFERSRLLPGSQTCLETWVVKLGTP